MRILITGITGFIGSRLSDYLKNAGHEIWGLSRYGIEETSCLVADLLDQESVRKAFAEAPNFDAVLHLAAIAHGEKPPLRYDIENANVAMTVNLLKFLNKNLYFVFFSSVAVYSESGQEQFVTPFAETNPLTAYGKSKVVCESLILQNGFKKIDIIRLPPVFDELHLSDIKKRVFFPFERIRFLLYPNPKYSLCKTDKICSSVTELLSSCDNIIKIFHIADNEAYFQRQLCSWFKGPIMPLPIFFLLLILKRPIANRNNGWMKTRYYLRKLLLDNCYDTNVIKIIN